MQKKMFNSTKISKIEDEVGKNNLEISHRSHLLKSIEVGHVKNTFQHQDFILKISGGGIEQKEGVPSKGGIQKKDQHVYSSTSADNNGVLFIMRGLDKDVNKVIVEGNSLSDTHPFLEKYQGWNNSNLTQQITKVDEKFSMVKKGHPLLQVWSEMKFDKKVKSPAAVNGWVSMPNDQLQMCLDVISENLENKIQIMDLTTLEFEISREEVDPKKSKSEQWIDTRYGFQNYDHDKDPKSVQGALDQKGTIIVPITVWLKNV